MQLRFVYKVVGICVFVISILLAQTISLYALDFRGGERIEIDEREVIEDDLIIGGQTIIIKGTVKGDVIFGSATFILDGTIEGDLMGGGSEIQINGTVTDDVRVGGAALRLGSGATVGDDLMMGGYSLETESDSNIAGQLYFGGGQALLSGNIGRDLLAGTGALEIRGTVGGNVIAEVGSAADAPPFNPMQFQPNAPQVPTVLPGLTIADDASIGGRLEYTTREEVTVPDNAVREVIFNQRVVEATESTNPLDPARFGFSSLGYLVAYLLIALLLVWLLAPLLHRSRQALHTHFGPSLGWGLVATFGIPFALILFMSLIFFAAIFDQLLLGRLLSGIISAVGVLTFLTALATFILTALATFILLFSFVSKIVVGYWLGCLLFRDMENMFLSILVGLIIIALLVSAPFIGWLLSSLIGVLGLGAIIVTRTGFDDGAVSEFEI